MKPLVSIGLPVYNGDKDLALAIESLLAQSYDNFELIILDNASTDSTELISKDYASKDSRISYFHNRKNIGYVRNFNQTFLLSKGEYFMWAAADDRWSPSYIEKCIFKLRENPTAAMCRTQLEELDRHSLFFTDTTQLNFYERALRILYSWFLYGVYRSSFLKRTRLLLETFAADRVLELEILLMGDIILVDEPLMYYHIPTNHKDIADFINDFGIEEEQKEKLISAPWSNLFIEYNNVINQSIINCITKQELKDLFYNTIINDNILISRFLIGNEHINSQDEIAKYLKGIFT